MLHCSVDDLKFAESRADDLYREVKLSKKDGTVRTCYDAKPPLKAMQARIQCLILKRVTYPSYLMGGLVGRDCVHNALEHAGARVRINEDISRFYPSTSSSIVFDIWKYFFHFPLEVSRTLERLTTRRGELPQGAKTSSYLANLAFWACEPDLVAKLRSMGFDYTRYIDDMTISSKTDKTAVELGQALSLLASMIKRYGLKFKRSKHSLVYAGQRMEVTGLVVGSDGAGLGAARKSSIRALVHTCELEALKVPASDALLVMLKRRAASLVSQYTRLHPGRGQPLKRRLEAIDQRY